MKTLFYALLLSLLITHDLSAAPLTRELLLFQDIPTVFTASKKEQAITESPSAVSFITDEDIRAYGATNIPDILRTVAGVDVMAISATDFNINIRGFNKEISHKLLVLLDGRSVILDFMGIVLWESLPVTLEDIKRIEIVKGPGSAIWGGNAYSGVINIVTKKSADINGSIVSISYGEHNTLLGSVIHGGHHENTSYKISAGWKQENNWDKNSWGPTVIRSGDDLAMENKKGSFTVTQSMAGGVDLTISGGIDSSFGEVLTALDIYRRDNTSSYLKLDYQRDWLSFHSYWNNLDTEIKEMSGKKEFSVNSDTYDFELEGIFDSTTNSLVFGINYRINTVDADILSGHNQQGIWGLYLQNDFRPVSNIILTGGARYDNHPLVGWNLSPRAAIIYTPVVGHTFRLSYTTAYSLPTFTESYLYRENPVAPSVNIVSRGNRDVAPEKIRSWEAGYKGQFSERIKGSIELFYNELEDFITFVPSADAYLIVATPPLFSEYKYSNEGKYKAEGGEAALDFYLSRNLTAKANYSYQYIWNDMADTRVCYSPISKAFAELRYNPKRGVNTTFWVNYVGETNWTSSATSEDWLPPATQTTRAGTDPKVNQYLLFNFKTGYRFTEDTELSLSAFNLFDNRHREFIAGDEIGRKVAVNFITKF